MQISREFVAKRGMKNPTISVIVPVYNTEKYLHRCIDSILGQTFTDFELLLINDGSTDSSGQICDEYAGKDSRIRVFHKENGGVSSARNVGLKNSIGAWIAFADSDDYVDSDWVEVFVKYSDRVDWVIQGFKIDYSLSLNKKNVKNKEEIVLREQLGVTLEEVKDLLCLLKTEKILGYLWCKMFKGNIVRNNNLRFNENVSVLEDEGFILRYSEHVSSFYSSSKTSYWYFFPDYGKKYKVNKECVLDLWNSVKTIFINNDNRINIFAQGYANQYIRYLTRFYKHEINRNKRLTEIAVFIDLFKDYNITPLGIRNWFFLSVLNEKNLIFTDILLRLFRFF